MSLCTLRGHRVCLVILTAFLWSAAGNTPTASPPSWFWGCWIVTKALPTTGISGLSQEQVDTIIGTRLVFTPSCARSGRTVASSPEYSTRVLSDREFFEFCHFALSQIGVSEKQVTEVTLVKPELPTSDFLANYVFLRKTDIVIEAEGVYFAAKRAKPGDPACTCKTPEAK